MAAQKSNNDTEYCGVIGTDTRDLKVSVLISGNFLKKKRAVEGAWLTGGAGEGGLCGC
jgi:hypothetical protein